MNNESLQDWLMENFWDSKELRFDFLVDNFEDFLNFIEEDYEYRVALYVLKVNGINGIIDSDDESIKEIVELYLDDNSFLDFLVDEYEKELKN